VIPLLIVDPGLSKAFQIPTYKVTEKNNYCRHWAANIATDDKPIVQAPSASKSSNWFFGSQAKTKDVLSANTSNACASDTDGLWIYCYPNAGINCYEPAWYSMRVIPLEKNKTRLEYEIFGKKGVDESKIQEFVTFLKEVEKEVCGLRSLR